MRLAQWLRSDRFRAAVACCLAAGTCFVAQAQYGPGGVPAGPGQPDPIQRSPAPNPEEFIAFRAALSQTPAQSQVDALQNFLQIYPNSRLAPEAQRWLRMAQMRAGVAPTAPPPVQQPPAPVSPPPPAVQNPAPSVTSGPPLTAAKPAIIQFGNHSLTIRADNSSLSQILREVAKSSGMTLEGLSRDQRVYGSYGPGEPRDVLSALLDGSGYNIFMLGESDRGLPLQLTLSPRLQGAGGAAPNQPQGGGDQDDEQMADDQSPPDNDNSGAERGFIPPQPPDPNMNQRTPQQMLEELRRMHQRIGEPQQQPDQQQDPQPDPQ